MRVPFFRTLVLGGILGVSWMLATPVQAADAPTPTKVTTVEGITEYRLANGFRFLLFPDPSKPLVTVNLTVFVGSRHEGYGETGMAHLLEHLLFKGTPTHPNVPKALRDHGARFNGTTWVDRTNYFETMPASDENLEFGIHLEADRLVNSFVKRDDLISEMTVVRNEFEMGENNPERILSQRMMATAFEWHNYGKSTIGNRSDIERVPIENLQAFYRKYYRVDNALLVVAGKFDEKKAIASIVKHFGALKKPETELSNTYTEEPAQDGERLVILRRVGAYGATGVVYHIPAGPHPDFPALEVLEDCLTASPAGRVYKALVESKLATSVSGSCFAWHDPGVIEITARVEGDNTEKVRDSLIETLENLAKNPITEEEVNRSKVRFAKYQEQLMSQTDSLAVRLSEWAAAGDWRLFFLHRDRIEKVTANDVNRVAKQYLTRNNRTVGMFIPSKQAERASIPETPKLVELLKDYKGRTTVATGEAFDPTPENIEKRVVRGKLGELQTAALVKKTRGETMQFRLTLRFGNEQSLKDHTTAVSLLGPMMLRGTAKYTRQQLTDELDRLQTQLVISSDLGALTVTIQTKKANILPVLDLLEEILRKPTFPEAEFELLKRENLERLNQAKTDPQALAVNMLQRKMSPYGKDDIRYVPTIEETIARLQGVKLAEIKELYQKQIGATKGELVVLGDVDPAPVFERTSKLLAGWKSDVPFARIPHPAPTDLKGEKEVILTPDKANAVFVAGTLASLKDSDPEHPALLLGNYLLGGAPLASRLSVRVRGEQGLSYGIGSMYAADSIDARARFMIFAITNPANIGKVTDLVDEEVKKFLKEGISISELDDGKRAFLESLKVQRSDDSTLSTQLGNSLYLGRTFQYYADLEKKISDLKPSDLDAAMKKLIDPKKIIIIQAGDFKK